MKPKLKPALKFIFLLLLVAGKTHSQTDNLRFDHIGSEQGLTGTWITCILQDSKGYVWIGTDDGLNKYDGYTFTKYKFDPLDSNSLSQNLVYTIWEDKEGIIWTSTFEGLCKFDRTTEKFARFKPEPGSKFNDPNITSINEDNTGTMWLGGASGQLGRFDKHTGKFYNESFDLGFHTRPGEALHDAITLIYKDKEGVLWVGNLTGLHKLIIRQGRPGFPAEVSIMHYVHDPENPNSISHNIVSGIFEDHSGILWISTAKGLNSFNKETNEFKHYLHDSSDNHSISTDELTFWGSGTSTIVEDAKGNLWIATTGGLNKLNKARTEFSVYKHDPSDENSISSDTVDYLSIDRSGILWATSRNGVLNKANLIQKPFGLKFHEPGNSYSLNSNLITAILEDSSGTVWIGTADKGMDRWDKNKDQFMHYRHDPNNPKTLTHDFVYALLEDEEGNLWVCNGDRLSLLNRQTGEFTHYNTNEAHYRDLDHYSIYSITEDADGIIWLGTGNGIKSFNKKTREFRHYYHDPLDSTGIIDYTAQAIFADSRDNIWVGYGSIGTDRLNKKTGHITHFKYDPHDSASISCNIVKGFYEEPGAYLWLATHGGGLCRFDYTTEKFKTFTEIHGLPDNLVFSVVGDDQRALWLSTANGISRFDPARKIFTNYDYKDGLQGDFFAAGWRDRPSHFKGRDGMIYFGGQKGFNFFDPKKIKTDSSVAPVVITRFNLFDKPVKGANESDKIILKHDENYFSFEFAALSFDNSDKNQYAYKLEGVDKDWVYSGSRRYAGYTDIPPGKYNFRVKATNSDGVWNEEGAAVKIVIRPPWWLSWWAYIIYALLLAYAGLLVHRYQKQKVIRAEREKARVKEFAQAKEIEKAYYELKTTQQQLIQSEKMASLGELTAGIAHEIQNPLNFVNNFSDVNSELIDEMQAEMQEGNYEEANAISKNIKENEEKIKHHGRRADAIVKGMLQHSRASTGKKEPTEINALCDEYLRLAYHGFRARDKTFNAEIKTYIDNTIGKIDIVTQDMGRALLNLINNAFYAVNEKSKRQASGYQPQVIVGTKKINDKIEISVKDNGNGIPESIIEKIFQPFFTTKPAGQGTGLGLSLSYDIVKAHGGEISLNSTQNEGTEFIIQLPIAPI